MTDPSPYVTEMSKIFATLDGGGRIAFFCPKAYEARLIEEFKNYAGIPLDVRQRTFADELAKIEATLDDGSRIAVFCPKGYEARLVQEYRNNARITLEEMQIVTAEGVAKAMAAMATAADVSEEVQAERLAICRGCEYFRKKKGTTDYFCGVCKCTLKSESFFGKIVNMLRKVEKLVGWPTWGCKHPQRGKVEGKGWRR